MESVSPSAQPLYTLVPGLFTCSQESDRVTINWVSWCLPKHLTDHSVMNMFAGITAEDQCEQPRRALTKAQQAKMSAIATAWVGQQ